MSMMGVVGRIGAIMTVAVVLTGGVVVALWFVVVAPTFAAMAEEQERSNSRLQTAERQLARLSEEREKEKPAALEYVPRAEFEKTTGDLRELLGKSKEKSSNPPVKVDLKDYAKASEVTRLQQDVAALRKLIGEDLDKEKKKNTNLSDALTKEQSVVPTDVLLLGMHSENLHIGHYGKMIQKLLRPVRKGHDKWRVGFGYIRGAGDLNLLVPIDEPAPKDIGLRFAQIQGDGLGTTDKLEKCGKKIQTAFKDRNRARVCVILASAACVPVPEEELEDWKGMKVCVVLVGRDDSFQPMEEQQALAWQKLCRPGGVPPTTFQIKAKAAEKQDAENFRTQLSDYLRKLIQPDRNWKE